MNWRDQVEAVEDPTEPLFPPGTLPPITLKRTADKAKVEPEAAS